jgi:flagellar P-ring protein precursor FlgI
MHTLTLNWRHWAILFAALLAALLILTPAANATRLEDLCEIQGARPNPLHGIGLVVGLAGTGDDAKDSIARQAELLQRLDIESVSTRDLVSDNIAVVIVDAIFPPFAKEGTRIDIRVNALYDAESLEGGTLLETYLYGVDNEVYAVGQGPLSVGGFNADAGGASIRQNHVTAGRVPMGGFIEREIPSTITDGQRITLLLKRPHFLTANNIRDAVDLKFGDDSATALTPGAINVTIPVELRHDLVGFIAELLTLNVIAEVPSKVVINERTGTIVVGGRVIIKPCQVAHGNLTIEIARTLDASQPNPFGLGDTVVTESVDLLASDEPAYFMPVEGTSAKDVARALNNLQVTPRDMISIFQAIRSAGAMDADLETM